MNLQHIYNLCTELQSISGTKAKQQFLIDNRCDDFDMFLKWLLNPQIVTGIDRKKLKMRSVSRCFESQDLKDILDYLVEHNTGRDVDVGYCRSFMNANPEYEAFLFSVFTKSLKLGVDVKLVNKTYGEDFIFNWEIQQAYPIEKYPLKPNEWITITQKCNGVRATYYRGKIMARSGVEFKGFDHILNELNAAYSNYVLDGELMLKDKTGLTDNEAFRKATGIINSDGDKSEICMTVFDCLPVADFDSPTPKMRYSQRRRLMDGLEDTDNVRVLPVLYQGTDHTQIPILLDKMVAEDKEGLMVNLDVPYKRKRHFGILKVKRFYTMDLRVVSVEEGEGKYVGMLGKANVEFNGNIVGVGSGFTDEQRIKYWEDKDYLVNKIIEVKYKEISIDKKTGLQSLQFPVLVCVREDKTEPNIE